MGREADSGDHIHIEAFYIAKTPMTNTEYQRFAQNRGQLFEIPAGKGDHPVTRLTWYQACEYAEWAGMRLLSEAEWEKAASWEPWSGGAGGRKRRYPWGETLDRSRCNTSESDIGDNTPVDRYGDKGASPCGAWEMTGNVWEWCSGAGHLDFKPRTPAVPPATGTTRTIHGTTTVFGWPVGRLITLPVDGFRVIHPVARAKCHTSKGRGPRLTKER
jgi:formylglycine-generating enzyme required for sulfatase activity